jgi:signal transduction histidine kinase
LPNFQVDIETVSRIDAVPRILDVVCRITGMGFAAVARVTHDRWIACAVRDEIDFGLKPGGELPVETTICDEIRENGKLIVIDHVQQDDVFCNHPTPQIYGFQSYISVPIFLKTNEFFGTLCAIDPEPARLNTPETIGMFQLFAELIAFHLDAQEQLEQSQTALSNERETAVLREQFIAVLGHDLRNPLNAISSGAEVLLRMPLNETAASVAATVKRSAARMAGLIENLMDFARGRLGGGITLTRKPESNLKSVLEQAVEEVQITSPGRSIQCDIDLRRPVACDAPRIAQMLSNLLANALKHGEANGPVWVKARSDEHGFELSVANRGKPIPPHDLDRLFQPFWRATTESSSEGLGLGLYIASEIARAHEGALEVSSSDDETYFTFTIPARDVANAAGRNFTQGANS